VIHFNKNPFGMMLGKSWKHVNSSGTVCKDKPTTSHALSKKASYFWHTSCKAVQRGIAFMVSV